MATVSDLTTFFDLITSFDLTEKDVNEKITDQHIEVISRSMCSKWKSLPSHLGLDTTIVDDIQRSRHLIDESEKRNKFLTIWKEEKGSEATYKNLIGGLLAIQRRDNAESVCKLLKGADSVQQQQPEEQQQQPEERPVEQQQQTEASACATGSYISNKYRGL